MTKIYCVGLFRTGTNTIYEVFKRSFRSAHEFMRMPTLMAFQGYVKGHLSRADYINYVKTRDAEGNLEIDSSGFNYAFVDILIKEYPDAKFILTIRDCYSWINSCMGYFYRNYYKEDGNFIGCLLNSIDHLPNNRFSWTDRSSYRVCIEQMVKMWSVVNTYMLSSIPAERLLVLDTEELSHSICDLAAFAGVSKEALDPDHANMGDSRNYLECLDSAGLERLVGHHCSGLLAERFPDLTYSTYLDSRKLSSIRDTPDVAKLFSLDRFINLD